MSGNDDLYNMREREAEYGRMVLDEINEEIKKEEEQEEKSKFFTQGHWHDTKEYNELREILAKYVHDDNWATWMKHLYSRIRLDIKENGQIFLDKKWFDSKRLHMREIDYYRWERLMNTLYEDLPEAEKKSDREIAQKLIGILGKNGYLIKKIDRHTEFELQ